MGLFTQDVQKTAQRTIEKNTDTEKNEAAMQHRQQTTRGGEEETLSDYIIIENLPQLYQSMINPRSDHGYKTINPYMSGAFLGEDELQVVRGHSVLYQSLKNLGSLLGDKKLAKSCDMVFSSMLAIEHSSKSREGASYKTLITRKSEQIQRFRDESEHEEEQRGMGMDRMPEVGLGIPSQDTVAMDTNPEGF